MSGFLDGLKAKLTEFGVVAALGGNPAKVDGLPEAAPREAEEERDLPANFTISKGDTGLEAVVPVEALEGIPAVLKSSSDEVPRPSPIILTDRPAAYAPAVVIHAGGVCKSGSGLSEGGGLASGGMSTLYNQCQADLDAAILIRTGLGDDAEYTRLELPEEPLLKRAKDESPKGHGGGPN